MADRRPNLVAIKSRASSPSETQLESALTDEHDTGHGVANTDAGVSADEAARVRRLHADAETVVGVE